MGREVQIIVAVLAALGIVLLATWGVALLAGTGAGHDLRAIGVVLFLGATATFISAIAVVASRRTDS
jgi:hypothetical protein